jgi:hypothetical protein
MSSVRSGTELPIPNVRSSVTMEGKAGKICSMQVLRILIHFGILRCNRRAPHFGVRSFLF